MSEMRFSLVGVLCRHPSYILRRRSQIPTPIPQLQPRPRVPIIPITPITRPYRPHRPHSSHHIKYSLDAYRHLALTIAQPIPSMSDEYQNSRQGTKADGAIKIEFVKSEGSPATRSQLKADPSASLYSMTNWLESDHGENESLYMGDTPNDIVCSKCDMPAREIHGLEVSELDESKPFICKTVSPCARFEDSLFSGDRS